MKSRRLCRISAVCVVLLLIAVGITAAGQSVIIASWNVENLGANTDVQERAEIIRQFDIVALQEVLSIVGLDKLLACVEAITGDDWDVVTSPKVGEGNAAEFYAFMYRTASVAYIEESSGVYQEPMPDDFSREPFFASFRAGEFDFTLITVHITWGDLASLRTAECRRLQSVWNYVQNMDSEEDDLILLGDFNRDKPTHSAFDLLLQMGITSILTETGTRTTFGRTATGGSWYDHIWIDPQHTGTELTDEIGVGTPRENSYGGGCASSLEGVSDHCTIWAIFDTTNDDDPLCP
jgi:endonuclease/exonuclease/phosphatase family metal-dependent hydrolase